MEERLTMPVPIAARPRAAARIAIVVALLAAEFAVRALVDEPGPLFLVPTLLAGLWFGRWGGVLTGAGASGLFAAASAINPSQSDLALIASLGVRAAIYCLTGYVVGLLVEQRRDLGAEVAVRDDELTELHAIQEALSPAGTPPRPGLRVAAEYLPARDAVAGDFYVVAAGPSPDTTVAAVGDVAGKGVEAARRAAFVRTALATSAPFVDDPARLLEIANHSLIERAGESSAFVTALCLVFRPQEDVVRLASAGHLPPLALDSGERVEPHRAPPLGIRAGFSCSARELPLPPGGGIVAFTDGLTEARSGPGGQLLGEEGVAQAVRDLAGARVEELVERLAAEAQSFAGGALDDDLCILAVRAEPGGRGDVGPAYPTS
jgi:serine phosphatase RsbU (regulator of sigma subunit)